jgi:thiol-disulfide isomerase/thioredoxin
MNFGFTLSLLAVFCLLQAVVGSAKPDLDPTTFKEAVLGDSRVWMVEFYSTMCGGCQEFASTWERIEQAFDNDSNGGAIASGKISIDSKEGLKLAEELGVLEDGVPHVRVFKQKDDQKGTAVVKGMVKSAKARR